MNNYLKLSQVTNLTIKGVQSLSWKMWDAQNKKMLVSKTPVKGYKKTYTLSCEEGIIDLTQGQIGGILEACFGQKERGIALSDLRGAKIKVGNNGKSGIDIRYWFRFDGYDDVINQDDLAQMEEALSEPEQEDIDVSKITF